MPRNCLSHSLDQWTGVGGYLLIARASSHPWFANHPEWVLQHVMHMDDAARLTSYVPEAALGHPAQALWGFDGVIRGYDDEPAPPMPTRGIVIGATLLTLAVYGWAIKRAWKKWRGQ